MQSKLTSRKFWLAAAAFLASLGMSISALMASNETVAAVGVVCTMVSAAIYAAAEAYVDGQYAASNITEVVTSIGATTTAKDTVEKMLASGGTDGN